MTMIRGWTRLRPWEGGARGPGLLAWAAIFALSGVARAEQEHHPDSVAVIVNKENALSEMSLKELRLVFRLDRRTWASGSGPIAGTDVSLVLRNSECVEQKVVLDRIYEMTADQLERYWVEIIYQGKISGAPVVKAGASQAIRAVSRNASGISIVLLKDVTPDVKVLKIDGFLPGDSSYPLLVAKE